jgi:4-hydroxy-tetrahydrodipicolinate synthase
MRTPWTGAGTALVTPFTGEGAVDEAAVKRLARRQIDAGIHFLVPCGTTGESPTLSEDERVRIIELVVEEAAGRVPVLAGAGGYDTREVIHTAQRMKRAGATGILSVTPYYNKPTPEGLFQHYSAIAGEVGLPVILYNVPGRTGCNIDVSTLVRLSGVPGIIGVKEASGNIAQMVEICGAVPKDFLVLSGDDALTLPLMAVGGHGIISVAGNEVPGEMARMVEHAERNDFAAARRVHAELLPLMLVNFIESNPIPVKSAMAAMGLLEEVFRLPMVPPRDASRARIRQVLDALKTDAAMAGASGRRS